MKKPLLILVLFLLYTGPSSQTPEAEKVAIAKTIHLYFEGMMELDRTKLDQAFDPSARLIGYREDRTT
jgi:hypothetical protein